jgi:hypothetical protein
MRRHIAVIDVGDNEYMEIAFWLLAAPCVTLLTIHLTSVVVATIRCRPRPVLSAHHGAPGVTLLRPVCGLDNFA